MAFILTFHICVLTVVSFLPPSTIGRPDDLAAEVTCTFVESSFTVGTTWSEEGMCKGWACQEDGTVASQGCRKYKLQEGCFMVKGDASKNYPECCDQPSCPHLLYNS